MINNNNNNNNNNNSNNNNNNNNNNNDDNQLYLTRVALDSTSTEQLVALKKDRSGERFD